MKIVDIERLHKTVRYALIGILMGVSSPYSFAEDRQVVDEAAPQQLTVEEVQALDGVLSEMKAMAPKLRVTLRSVRRQVGFDARKIHSVERNISQSQKDIERLIAMHQRGAVNQMRAHFLVDDLRRKSDGLKESLNYLVLRVRELDSAEEPNNGAASESNDALVELLGLYSALVDDSVVMLQGKAF
ncbi:MAG: hypothetical protein KZQ77_17760 [Candidatus Thiodiazotropha sp. (ex Notomyrtea botanica)]|nr:hypothetical protein [Candidatus Thiodiazotropha sp. (ex Notomyrtea botanica)]